MKLTDECRTIIGENLGDKWTVVASGDHAITQYGRPGESRSLRIDQHGCSRLIYILLEC